jgi:hypothetical protein
MSPQEALAHADHIAALVQKLDPWLFLNANCPNGRCPAPYFLNMNCTDLSGQLISDPLCASNIAALFSGSELVSAGSGNQGSGGSGNQGSGGSGNQGSGGSGNQGSETSAKRQPFGELISVNLELAGLQGQPVFLSWSIFQKDGENHLSKSWLGNFVAYRLEGTTNDDTGTLEMWIPLPKQHGPYFVRLTLTSPGGASLASMDSGLFD